MSYSISRYKVMKGGIETTIKHRIIFIKIKDGKFKIGLTPRITVTRYLAK